MKITPSLMIALIAITPLHGCAVIAVADAAITVGSAAVSVAATTVSTGASIVGAGVEMAADAATDDNDDHEDN